MNENEADQYRRVDDLFGGDLAYLDLPDRGMRCVRVISTEAADNCCRRLLVRHDGIHYTVSEQNSRVVRVLRSVFV